MVTNKEFIEAIYGADADYAHVTSFTYDPSNIPKDKQAIAWGGDYWSKVNLIPNSNQYATVSIFKPDVNGKARRRKPLFMRTIIILLDDVREKLSYEEAQKLPKPTWILETSEGSEQYGYKLTVPETNQSRVDNLQDGLIASDLAPSGKDSGQKNTTRYFRLPEGINNKASKLVNGEPFKCRMLEWNPTHTVTMEQMAEVFCIDLNRPRKDSRVDGAAKVPDHPILHIPDIVNIKSTLGDGRYDVTCLWVDEHTDQTDNGTAIFTNNDGSLGYRCHHGACESRNAADLMKLLEREKPGFGEIMASWKVKRSFGGLVEPGACIEPGLETSWVKDFVVRKEVMDKINDPTWIVENLIIQGHFIVIPAPPNGGKTTIMLHLSGVMAEKGYDVFYVNADVSAADAKSMQIKAADDEFSLLLPDFNEGKSMKGVVDNLERMASVSGDYSNLVFIFDTLKKMTDVINKSQSKKLYKTLRSLTAKGMTIICLSHTNKYKGEDNLDVFEGTGDLRSDVDEMIFLTPIKNGDGSMTVSTRPDKVRGVFKPITFSISVDRAVSQKGLFIDVGKQKEIESQREGDAVVIELIEDALLGKCLSQSEVVSAVRDRAPQIGEKRIRTVLNRWSTGESKLWNVKRHAVQNRKEYYLDISFL